MTTFYLRSTTTNTSGYAAGEKSTTLPLGTFTDSGASPLDLSQTAGTSQATRTISVPTTAVEQSNYWGKWISEVIQTNVTAQTWSYALAGLESVNTLNYFFRLVIYVLTSGDTVRGLIYDGTADLGSEITAASTPPQYGGITGTVSGAAVSGVSAGSDRIACEVWSHGTPSMTGSGRSVIMAWDGATAITNGGTAADNAAFVSTPQDLTAAPAPPRNPGCDFGATAMLMRAHQAMRRWRHGRHGILVPDGMAWTC